MITYKNGDPRRARQGARPGPQTNVSPELLEKIAAAVASVDAIDKKIWDFTEAITDAQKERDALSEELGHLLIEAKAFHVSKKTFDAFVEKYVGLKKSRVYELMRIAGGKTTDETVKKKQRERKAKSRTKKKQSKSGSPPDSVTKGSVTEKVEIGNASISPQGSADQRRAENAAAEIASAEIDATESTTDKIIATESAAPVVTLSEGDSDSAFYLKRFKEAAERCLHRLNAADLEAARSFVAGEEWKPKEPEPEPSTRPDLSIPANLSIPNFLKREATAASATSRSEKASNPCLDAGHSIHSVA